MEDREKWEKDVKEYNLPWPVVSDLKAYSGPGGPKLPCERDSDDLSD